MPHSQEIQSISLSLNKDGSLIGLGKRQWLVCFVPPIDKQWWHKFVMSPYKHAFAIRHLEDTWTIFEPWWGRLLVANIHPAKALKYLKWASQGDVLLVKESVPGSGRQYQGWMNCASLIAYLLGRPFFVWTPSRLRENLLAEPDVRRVKMDRILEFELESEDRDEIDEKVCDICRQHETGKLRHPFCSSCFKGKYPEI